MVTVIGAITTTIRAGGFDFGLHVTED